MNNTLQQIFDLVNKLPPEEALLVAIVIMTRNTTRPESVASDNKPSINGIATKGF